MEKGIGEMAGILWRYLSEHGETRIVDLAKLAELPKIGVERAIGWLAREDKVILTGDGKKETAALKI